MLSVFFQRIYLVIIHGYDSTDISQQIVEREATAGHADGMTGPRKSDRPSRKVTFDMVYYLYIVSCLFLSTFSAKGLKQQNNHNDPEGPSRTV